MPTPRSLRPLLGTAFAAAFTGGAWQYLRTTLSLGLFVLAAALFLLALCAPNLFAPVQKTLERLGRAVAGVFTVLLLGLVFALVFIPGRGLLALLRRDPLQRRPDPARPSYWEPLPPTGPVDRFRRQY